MTGMAQLAVGGGKDDGDNEDTGRQEWQPLPAPRSLQLLYPRPSILIFGS